MATELSSLLGNELVVGIAPPTPQRIFTGFAGADGIIAMDMGHRGYVVPITGQVSVYGDNYATARDAADDALLAIGNMQYWSPAAYTHKGSTYYYAIFHGYKALPGRGGKTYRYTTEGYMLVKFTINLIGLVSS